MSKEKTEYGKIMNDFLYDEDSEVEFKSLTTDTVNCIMACRRLDRIADALEAINSNLADISATLDNIDQNIDGCIAQNGNNKFLCITGNIANY